MEPSRPPEAPRRPVPKIAFEASRTAMLVAVRTADLAIVSPIESLRRDDVLGTGDDCGRRGRGMGGDCDGDAPWPHGPEVGVGPGIGGATSSYWPRRRWPLPGGTPPSSCCIWPS